MNGSRGVANLVMRCKFCKRDLSAREYFNREREAKGELQYTNYGCRIRTFLQGQKVRRRAKRQVPTNCSVRLPWFRVG